VTTKGPYRGGSQEESYLDSDGVIKNVHDRYGQALRVTDAISVIKSKYTHFRATYNLDNQPTQVTYYRGTKAHKTAIGCSSDVAGSLNNKYLLIRSAPDNKLYHIWINVDNTGVDPAPANSTPIEVNISLNDPGLVVAQSIVLTINSLFKDQFYATRIGTVAEIVTQGYGVVDNSDDVDTTFPITNDIGEQETLTDLVIEYQSGDPVFNGQVLKDYRFEIFSGLFKHKEEISLGTLNVNANTDAFGPDPDSNLSVGSENGTALGVRHVIRVDSDLDLRVGISNGTNKANVNLAGELSVVDNATNASLSTINTTLTSIDAGIPSSLGANVVANSMPVTIATDQAAIPISGNITATLGDEPIKISGTIDGTANGTEYNFVYNLRQQILAAHDREQLITYADFGTKNQRVTQIDYTSDTFPGIIARKTLSYTLVGTRYRRDSINWSII
jgi:hypothetical protein